jgi:hypothetical protein
MDHTSGKEDYLLQHHEDRNFPAFSFADFIISLSWPFHFRHIPFQYAMGNPIYPFYSIQENMVFMVG